MREMKFKFWLENVKSMMGMYNFSLCCEEGDYSMYKVLLGKDESVIPLQFTGLLDKTGNEIYEGDIVKGDDSVAIVKFDDELGSCGCCYDKFLGSGFAAIHYDDCHDCTVLLGKYCEVIGNIYQNKDIVIGRIDDD